MSEHDHEEFERKIREGKKRRMNLRERKAAAKAQLKEAQKKLQALKDKAEEMGYDLKELPEVANEKKKLLNGKLAAFNQALDEAEERMSQYEQEE